MIRPPRLLRLAGARLARLTGLSCLPRFPSLSRLSFRTKINCGIVLIVGLVSIPLAYLTWRAAAQSLQAETRKRGLVLSENLAMRVSDAMLSMDLLRLKNMVDELRKVDDIVYAFILDRDGRVLVHTFRDGFPVELTDANAPAGGAPHIQLLDTGRELIDDFAAPVVIVGTPFGTARIGLSRTKAEAAADRLALMIVFYSALAMVAALAPSTLFARRVTERINRLKIHAEEVVKGNLDLRTGPRTEDACSAIMACDKAACPAHGDRDRRCWLTASPDLYRDGPDSCRACPVYREQKGDEIQDLAETFDVMAVSLKTHLDELRRAERVLTRQERLLRTILDATPDLVCLLDERLTYLAVNRAFATFVGRDAQAIVGATDEQVFPADEGAAMHGENRLVLTSGRPSDREVQLRRGGAPVWLHVVRVPVTDASGRAIGLLRTARDVTQLKQFQEQLIQAQKMESLGKLAGGVAHEINTPLGVILGYSQLLQEDVPPDSQILVDLQTIEKQAKVCRKIVADLLGFSRQAESAKIEMCFNNSLMEAVTLVRHAFSLDQAAIATDLDERMPIIYGDPEKLKQVWINLLANARDALDRKGGTLLVRSRLFAAEQKVTAWFADTGPGISPDNQSRIFDPFFTTKPVGQGTGLGLSVSFGIIKDHGGTITVASPVPAGFFDAALPADDSGNGAGPGTVFTVDLPLDHEETLGGKEAAGPVEG
ncbi:multi-sensor signal transduction histidine kinase [Solidesulfovibrio carbinoliphilus subsp. oakridgensis]|uniref:histidine kinase n=1 Tax=Solidesulfovibrio carbinoliphilus subsp. oakridgensis TaxID=694327 RepID=G7Q8K1_9BACT|nr:ATP-binding protein [Solidesulfovibrio carbinoliphilus]EHJ49088.1 multi-sensor signal transduction histidine kinase [Solidesulfovibrio carbinoliphilus subsp. oakridgensis]